MRRELWGLLIIACGSGCSLHQKPAPLVRLGNYHFVQPNESLCAVAWQHQVNYKTLAEWNNLVPPYTLYPGQTLRLQPEERSFSKRPPPTKKPAVTEKPSSKVPQKWIWPATGKLLCVFKKKAALPNHGIDIAGTLKSIVVAAREGEVVYSGSALKDYGQLIIIKHDADYLSVYGHNHKVYVKEGQKVRQGEKIALMGDTGSEAVKLHFEIRYRGNPVDPLKHLPVNGN